MSEPAIAGIDSDELRLAQLACGKLAGLVQGALSVGLPALVTAVPEPRSFFDDRFRVMTGFALVLHSISGKPDGQRTIEQLRERSQAILTALDELRLRLLEHLDSSGESAGTLALVRPAASALCDAIGAYGDLIQLDRSRIAKVKSVVLQVFDGVDSLNELSQPTAR